MNHNQCMPEPSKLTWLLNQIGTQPLNTAEKLNMPLKVIVLTSQLISAGIPGKRCYWREN